MKFPLALALLLLLGSSCASTRGDRAEDTSAAPAAAERLPLLRYYVIADT